MARLAEKQWGLVSREQLLSAGLSGSTISRWVGRGLLIRIHPGVYAVGHRRHCVESRLAAALLLAGHPAALSHESATYWWGITPHQPAVIDVRAPGRRRSRPGIRFHRSRQKIDRLDLRGLPVVSPSVALLGYAAQASAARLRRAVTEAYRLGLLDPGAIRAELRCGRAGSAALRDALDNQLPELASTLSMLEEQFLLLVAGGGIALPEVNVTVGGMMVDALFREQRLVVELDGHEFHANPAAVEEDRRRELRLRALGYRIVRYTWQQVTQRPAEVLEDLKRQLKCEPGRAPGS